MAVRVYLEVGSKRVFASAADWPGWSRSGKDEAGALAALVAAGPRYRKVAERAGLKLEPVDAGGLDVSERLQGSATTDFGAPGAIAESEARTLSPAEAERSEALLRACWELFDEVVAGAPPELKKGPRGGGRDRDQIAEHVLGAEGAYATKVGLRLKPPSWRDRTAVSEWREALLEALRSDALEASRDPKRWPPAYAARRIAWHAVDHAWEIEDRKP